MLASNRVRVMRETDTGDDEQQSRLIEWALNSALVAILQAASTTLDPVTVGHYLPFAYLPGLARADA